MSMTKQCRTCGADVPGNAPFGHCPKCLLDLGFGPLPDEARTPSAADDSRRFGEYEIVEQLGRGGMGVVYKARQVRLNRLVALKMINSGEYASPMLIQRFRREAEAAANLHHPNIVPIYESGEINGQCFYSMQLIDGTGLDRHISRVGFSFGHSGDDARVGLRARQEEIARILAKVARAVDHAHQHGVLHRDLKPSNIILDPAGEPHLTDFGVAKVLGHDASSLTASGAIMGTPSYMAPEQAAGESKRITAAADTYSLGAILYAMLTGAPPFRADSPVETLRQVIEQEPKHPSTLKEGIDSDLATIAMKCLEKEPQRRYSSALELAEDLECWQRHETILARRAGPLLRITRWSQRNPLVVALIATLSVGLSASLLLLVRVVQEKQAKQTVLEERDAALLIVRRDLARVLEKLWDEPAGPPFEHIDSERLASWMGTGLSSRGTGVGLRRFNFAVYAQQRPSTMLADMAPILAHLEERLNEILRKPVRIDLRIYRDYDSAQKALVEGSVDFMRIGSASYIECKQRNADIRLLAAQNDYVKGCIFVRIDSPITRLEELRGKRVAFVDPDSTTGNLLPKFQLYRAGLRSRELLDRGTNYLFRHDLTISAVTNGSAHAGAARASIVGKFNEQSPVVRIIKEFGENIGMPWVGRSGLDPAEAKSLVNVLLAVRDARLLGPLGNKPTGFMSARDEDYNPLREAIIEARRFESE